MSEKPYYPEDIRERHRCDGCRILRTELAEAKAEIKTQKHHTFEARKLSSERLADNKQFREVFEKMVNTKVTAFIDAKIMQGWAKHAIAGSETKQ